MSPCRTLVSCLFICAILFIAPPQLARSQATFDEALVRVRASLIEHLKQRRTPPELVDVALHPERIAVVSGKLQWRVEVRRALGEGERSGARAALENLLTAGVKAAKLPRESLLALMKLVKDADITVPKQPPLSADRVQWQWQPETAIARPGPTLLGWDPCYTVIEPSCSAPTGSLAAVRRAPPAPLRPVITAEHVLASFKSQANSFERHPTTGAFVLLASATNNDDSEADVDGIALSLGGTFDAGYHAYWDGHHAEALHLLIEAAKTTPYDARIWYYKGLAEVAMGREAGEASNSFAVATMLDLQGSPDSSKIAQALQRVQGRLRRELVESKMLIKLSIRNSPKSAKRRVPPDPSRIVSHPHRSASSEFDPITSP